MSHEDEAVEAMEKLAGWLEADIDGLNAVQVEVAPTKFWPTRDTVADYKGTSLPMAIGTAIAISIRDEWKLEVAFVPDSPLPEQILDALDQVQDVIVESFAEPWPTCPLHHGHMLEPRCQETYVWACPENSEVFNEVGLLNSG